MLMTCGRILIGLFMALLTNFYRSLFSSQRQHMPENDLESESSMPSRK